MAGGGTSQSASFPTYLEDIHKRTLRTSTQNPIDANEGVFETLNAALTSASGNPWVDTNRPSAAEAYDSALDMTAVQTRYDTFDTEVTGLAEEADYDSMINKAIAKVDGAVITSAEIATAVAAFETNATARHMRAVSRFTGGMSDVNAVMSSQFVFGLALLEDELQREIDQFEQSLTLHVKSLRTQMVDSGTKQMVAMLQGRVQSHLAAAQTLAEIRRIKVAAMSERDNRNLEIDVREAKWDLDLFTSVANMIAAPGGAATITNPDEMSKFQTVMGGALAGASIGSKTGNPWLMAGGAVVGAGAALLNG